MKGVPEIFETQKVPLWEKSFEMRRRHGQERFELYLRAVWEFGTIAEAARHVGVCRSALHKKLLEHEIDVPHLVRQAKARISKKKHG